MHTGREFDIYNVSSGTWTSGPTTLVDRNHAFCEIVDGFLFVGVGAGALGSSDIDKISVTSLDAWETIAVMPVILRAARSITVDSFIFIFGGDLTAILDSICCVAFPSLLFDTHRFALFSRAGAALWGWLDRMFLAKVWAYVEFLDLKN